MTGAHRKWTKPAHVRKTTPRGSFRGLQRRRIAIVSAVGSVLVLGLCSAADAGQPSFVQGSHHGLADPARPVLSTGDGHYLAGSSSSRPENGRRHSRSAPRTPIPSSSPTLTATATGTAPSPTLTDPVSPTASVTAVPTPTKTIVPSPTWVSPTPSPTVTPSFVPTHTPTPTPTPTKTATKSPTPTPTPTESATAPTGSCATSAVWDNLAACGWAGPTNTGYPAGTTFAKTVTGGYTVTTDGTVINGWHVSGGIQVQAKNVVIENSWITMSAGGESGTGVVNVNPGASATITHNLLDGQDATHTCVWDEGSSMTATYNNCQGVNDGMFSWATTVGVDGNGDNFDIENNYFHSFTTQAANGHIDGYQTEGAKNGVIRHNTYDVSQDQDSDVAIWDSRKSSSNILVDHNLMAGGGFSIYAEDYSPSEASPAGGYSVTDITFTNNVFSTVHFACVGQFGIWYTRGAPTDHWNRSGNYVLETGQDVDNSNPIVKGVLCT
jgi:hypothetical protein